MSEQLTVIPVSSTQFRETTGSHKGVNSYEKFSSPDYKPGAFKIAISEKGMGNPETIKRRDVLARQTNEANVMLDEINLATLMTQLNIAAEGLETAGFNHVTAVNQKMMAFNNMEKSQIQLDVSNHELNVEKVKAPLMKAIASYTAETLHEQLLGTVGNLIKTRTDRAVQQWTLQQHGYDVSSLPSVPEDITFPHSMDFKLPEFVKPELELAPRQVNQQ